MGDLPPQSSSNASHSKSVPRPISSSPSKFGSSRIPSSPSVPDLRTAQSSSRERSRTNEGRVSSSSAKITTNNNNNRGRESLRRPISVPSLPSIAGSPSSIKNRSNPPPPPVPVPPFSPHSSLIYTRSPSPNPPPSPQRSSTVPYPPSSQRTSAIPYPYPPPYYPSPGPTSTGWPPALPNSGGFLSPYGFYPAIPMMDVEGRVGMYALPLPFSGSAPDLSVLAQGGQQSFAIATPLGGESGIRPSPQFEGNQKRKFSQFLGTPGRGDSGRRLAAIPASPPTTRDDLVPLDHFSPPSKRGSFIPPSPSNQTGGKSDNPAAGLLLPSSSSKTISLSQRKHQSLLPPINKVPSSALSGGMIRSQSSPVVVSRGENGRNSYRA